VLLGAVSHNTSLCLHQFQTESKALLPQATFFHDIVCTVREAYWCVLLLNSPHTLACLGLGVKTLNPNPAMDPPAAWRGVCVQEPVSGKPQAVSASAVYGGSLSLSSCIRC
jgi:hypothetical protein